MKLFPLISKVSIHILILVSLLILVYLGTWQLKRAEYKTQLHMQVNHKSHIKPDNLLKIMQDKENNIRFSRITSHGSILENKNIFLDGQRYNRKIGLRVFSIFKPSNHNKAILIDRGWLPVTKSRKDLPNIANVNIKEIIGTIQVIHPRPFIKKAIEPTTKESFPILMQSLDYELIGKILNMPVYKYVIQPDKSNLLTFTHIPYDLGIKPTKHTGYALQWFSLALLLVIYYLIYHTPMYKIVSSICKQD